MSIKTLEELKAQIKKERHGVGILPFSHNIIGLCLQSIAKKFGQEEANKTIRELKLKKLGWSEIKGRKIIMTTKTVKHTPLPWKDRKIGELRTPFVLAHKGNAIVDADGDLVCGSLICNAEKERFEMYPKIIEAVNNYERLKESNKELLEAARRFEQGYTQGVKVGFLEKLRLELLSAIAKAEEVK